MKVNNIKQIIGIILYFILIFGLMGCGRSSHNSDDYHRITGKAIDGYLQGATGCLDLSKDGICTSDEPKFTTNQDGSFSLDINVAHKAHKNYKTASLLIYGGIDKDTGNAFLGKLRTTYRTSKNDYNISPITTMLESLVRDESKTEAEAKKLVLDMLGLEKFHDLYQDPVELAKKDSSLLRASLQIQKSIEMVSFSLTNKDSENNKIENLYKSLAKELIKNKNDKLRAHLNSLISSHEGLENHNRGDIKSRTITIISEIDKMIQEKITNTQDIGTRIQYLQSQVKDKTEKDIEENIDFDKIKYYSFSEVRARHILISMGDHSKDKDKIRHIQEVLGREQLSREEEIKRLQNGANTETIGNDLNSHHKREHSDRRIPTTTPTTIPTTPTTTPGENSNLTPFQKSTLDEHNKIRAEVFNGNLLSWSNDLTKLAQDYANYLASTNKFEHDPDNKVKKTGENLYWNSSSEKPVGADATKSWYSEKQDYTHSSNTCASGKVCGHYTQIVWKNTSEIGCAAAQNSRGWTTVCKYKTPGNYGGQSPY